MILRFRLVLRDARAQGGRGGLRRRRAERCIAVVAAIDAAEQT